MNFLKITLITVQQLILLALTLEIAFLIYMRMEHFGVYRIVSLVILSILYVNIMRAIFTVRKPIDEYDTTPLWTVNRMISTTAKLVSLRSTRK